MIWVGLSREYVQQNESSKINWLDTTDTSIAGANTSDNSVDNSGVNSGNDNIAVNKVTASKPQAIDGTSNTTKSTPQLSAASNTNDHGFVSVYDQVMTERGQL